MRIHASIGIIFQTESTKSYSICPHCGTKSQKLHQNYRHILKDLPFREKPVFLEINRLVLGYKNYQRGGMD
ncbi:transposase family protein [Nostoc punctiforme]|uniref:transposase family protein n=1 Tax=Nostoc punctiforme TaxID=272131 RepID=UPI002412AF94|nr:transposase family protein [Nostoc punctiforme]